MRVWTAMSLHYSQWVWYRCVCCFVILSESHVLKRSTKIKGTSSEVFTHPPIHPSTPRRLFVLFARYTYVNTFDEAMASSNTPGPS